MPPRLFEITVKSLNRVLAYVGFALGDSWEAKRTWERRKNDIPKEMVRQLYNYSEEREISNVEVFMRKLLY